MINENQVHREAVKFVVYVPETHADIVRETLGKVGAGTIGDYSFCSFSVKGTGRFLPMSTAHPVIGEVGKLEAVPKNASKLCVIKTNFQILFKRSMKCILMKK